MTMKSMGSSAEERFAACVREVGVLQWRVWALRRVAGRGWPRVAIVVGLLGLELELGVRVREAVCRMWVWGMETVMVMRRGGWGGSGAEGEGGEVVVEVVLGRWTVLFSCGGGLVCVKESVEMEGRAVP